jgi:dTMP kinase
VTAHSRGLFVTLEGGEGAGKSEQLRALSQRLEAAGRAVTCVREPGGTPLGDRIREVVLDISADRAALSPATEALLFVAARSELVRTVIAPALDRGDTVICDRYGDSTLAYQGYGRGLEVEDLERLNGFATGGLAPGLTVLLDLPAADGLARSTGGPDRIQREALDFHERVRQGYLALAGREPKRWLVIDALQSANAVTGAIWQRLEPLIQPSL